MKTLGRYELPADEHGVLAYRINTFPLIHIGFFHMLFNVLALTPLLERFESEYGTLTSLAMFFGREYKNTWDLV